MADEAGGGSAAASKPVAERRLGSVRKVQPLCAAGLCSRNRLHSYGGRQHGAGAAQRRCFAYQLCHVDVYRFRSAAFVSAGAVASYASHSTDHSPLKLTMCVCCFVFYDPILGNHCGPRVSSLASLWQGSTHPRFRIADVPLQPVFLR